MADEADIASEREELARAVALMNVRNRQAAPLPLCAECEETTVHIASNGCVCRVCMACACELGLVTPKAE